MRYGGTHHGHYTMNNTARRLRALAVDVVVGPFGHRLLPLPSALDSNRLLLGAVCQLVDEPVPIDDVQSLSRLQLGQQTPGLCRVLFVSL